MVDVRFVNDTTPIKVTSETQVKSISVKSSTGTDNHNELSNRDLPDQHPISAITGLQEALVEKQDVISDLQTIRSDAALGSTALQPNDNISELHNDVGYITRITSSDVTTALGYTPYNSSNPSNYQTATQVANSIATETTNRESADNNLQSQIDAIVSSSDVFDIVGTYAELQAYDIATVPVNDIIKVLVDSTHSGAATYYRCVETGGVKSWSYIGSEGAYYTKAEADAAFVPQTRTVNGKALSSNITLTATDVGADVSGAASTAETNAKNYADSLASNYAKAAQGALADTAVQPAALATVATTGSYNDLSNKPTIPTVNNPTITFTQGGTTKGTITLNQSSDQTIDLDAGGSSYTAGTGISIASDVISVDSTVVTTNTAQDITGIKTFIGEKRIKFKQSMSYNRLGFGFYSNLNSEVGALEYRPDTINGKAFLTISSPSSVSYVGFRYYGGNSINIVAPRRVTTGTYYIPVNLTDGNTTVTADDAGTVDISSLLPTKTSDLTNDSGYITSSALTPYVLSSSLATVATTGSYNDLSGTPSLSGYQTTSNLVTSISSSSTNTQYPSAKCVYDIVGDIETLINTL